MTRFAPVEPQRLRRQHRPHRCRPNQQAAASQGEDWSTRWQGWWIESNLAFDVEAFHCGKATPGYQFLPR